MRVVFLCYCTLIIIIMYIYHALINALSARMIHINLNIYNLIFYTHVEHSPTKTIYIKYYKIKIKIRTTNRHTHSHTQTHTHTLTQTHTHTHTNTHTHAHTHSHWLIGGPGLCVRRRVSLLTTQRNERPSPLRCWLANRNTWRRWRQSVMFTSDPSSPLSLQTGEGNWEVLLEMIIIIQVFVKHKILSVETILSAYTQTQTHTDTDG